MKPHHLLVAAVCSLIILAGGSFTCHSGDDDKPNRDRHALVAPATERQAS
jgi:hypothetical protein